jgi:4-hydroxy 2-oxovalerate aldolase
MKILDCTLRDGGYYNNWDFSDNCIDTYLNNIKKLPINYLEIGYRSNPQKEYFGKYFYLPDFVVERISKKTKGLKLAIMLNEKDIAPPDLDSILSGLAPHVSLIRMAVNPKNISRAIILAKEIKQKGFDVSFNMMYMSKYYNNDLFLNNLTKLNGLAKYIFLVDSYGGMTPDKVEVLIKNVKKYYNNEIGFHGHNNLELAFANALAAIDAGCDVIDSTIMGMGRGAGNLKTELLLTYLASKDIVSFDFNVLAKIIETWLPLYSKYEWGTNLPYMVSGAISMPQKDVMEWVTQRFYSYNSIIRALKNQEAGEVDNIRLPIFKPTKTFDNVLIIGGGSSAEEHATAIKRFIAKQKNICIIHASSKNAALYQSIDVAQYFCLVGNEGHRLEEVFKNFGNFKGQSVLPPFPRKMGTYIPEGIKNSTYELAKISFTDKYVDSHTALALETGKNLKVKTTYLVGYDGYSNNIITRREQALFKENEYNFTKYSENNHLISILPTQYDVNVHSVYNLI